MIDLHSHVLPGLDDGAADLDESLAICEEAAADGITVMAATPHVRYDHPTTASTMESALAEVRRVAEGIIEVFPGGELDLAELDRPLDELRRFGLGGNPGVLLVETPFSGWPLDLGDRLFRLRAAGFATVLAHPERNAEVQRRPELLEPLVAAGVLVQLTASSVDGRYGGRSHASCFELIERGLAHLIASDVHGELRAGGMSAAAEAVGDEELAHWLTDDVPRSIVERTTTPPRPEQVRPRRRRWFFLR
ncbi:MAG TPA: CpsB/CapC family capsule biosynthesis tyrosine phosphatase [Gaiellaceae bacterium]|nr:CpsB/CapC family capsule biosynthesis tyrosine phosphatase [Gaiellaceae bacterium]